jgi:hypothetical protein
MRCGLYGRNLVGNRARILACALAFLSFIEMYQIKTQFALTQFPSRIPMANQTTVTRYRRPIEPDRGSSARGFSEVSDVV